MIGGSFLVVFGLTGTVVVPNKVSKNRRYDTDVLEVISELTSLENVRVAPQIGTRLC